MIIPTPALIERVSSAKKLFFATLKSNFKTRLRYTLKHLGSMHDPLSHGNWSRGAGMYGGDAGKVGLAGKVRQRLGGDVGVGGGGGGVSGAGAPKGAKRGGYARTTKGALAQHETLRKAVMKSTAVRDHMLGRPETVGVTSKRAAFDKYNSEFEASLKDKPDQLAAHRKSIKNAQDGMATFRESLSENLFQATAKKYTTGKFPSTLRRDAQDAVGQTRDSIRGNTFRNALNKHEGKENVNRVQSAQTGLRTAVRTEMAAQQRDFALANINARMGRSVRDPSAAEALGNVEGAMIKQIQARRAKQGNPISENDARDLYRNSIIESGWQPRLTTSDNSGLKRFRGSSSEFASMFPDPPRFAEDANR